MSYNREQFIILHRRHSFVKPACAWQNAGVAEFGTNDMHSQREFLNQRYQEMWDGAIERVRRGDVIIDPVLASREPDRRRSLTVLVRPSSAVHNQVAAFLDQLRIIEPEQYHYDPAELHVTVLSLFAGTPDYERLLVRLPDYLEAVSVALAGAPTFEIEFCGVTLSREAVLVQGFPNNLCLEELREKLRQELRARDLTEGLDARYRLVTAHTTALRFRAPLQRSEELAQALEDYRAHDFGRTTATELHLVRNDWYMSRQSVEVHRRLELVLGTS